MDSAGYTAPGAGAATVPGPPAAKLARVVRPTTRYLLAAVAAAAVALAIVAVPVLLRDDEGPGPGASPTPKPGITAKARQVTSAPQVAAEVRGAATRDLGGALRTLYRTAFTESADTPAEPDPEATAPPRPSRRIGNSMTSIARRALATNPDVFDEGAGLSVFSGAVVFSGVITFDDERPVEALLEVDFLGDATPTGLSAPIVRVHQVGNLVMRNTESGWLVDGFDLRLATRPLVSPSPSS